MDQDTLVAMEIHLTLERKILMGEAVVEELDTTLSLTFAVEVKFMKGPQGTLIAVVTALSQLIRRKTTSAVMGLSNEPIMEGTSARVPQPLTLTGRPFVMAFVTQYCTGHVAAAA